MISITSFDKRRKWDNKRNKILEKLGYYGLFNFSLDCIANLVLRVVFVLSWSKPSLKNATCKEEDLVVSLTSFPKRIKYVWLTIETLLRQRVLPSKIALYLSKCQFPNEHLDLPKSIIKLQKRGLDIRFVDDDLRSHKKYLYAMRDFPDKCVITVDDDCLYPEDIIEALWKTHVRYPNSIVGNWAKQIYPCIPKYEHWPAIKGEHVHYDYLFVGCAGILYPPESLHYDAFNIGLIKKLAFTADDIWLSCMARLRKTSMVSTTNDYHHLRVIIPGNNSLHTTNAVCGNQMAVDNLNNYYYTKIGRRPFVDMVGHD